MQGLVRKLQPEDVMDLRIKVLLAGRNVEQMRFPLDDREFSAHFGYFSEAELISVGTVHLDPRQPGAKRSWRLRGMATDPEHQGKGYGAQVLAACIEYVRSQGGVELWCNARTAAASFYLRAGFEKLSAEPFDMPGIGPHFIMRYSTI